MESASHQPSPGRRLRALALAGILAAGLVSPLAPAAVADSSTTLPGNVGGLEITVQTVEDLDGLTAVAVGNGEAINLRAEPTADAEVLASIPDGSVVPLRVDTLNTELDDGDVRWWPATWEGVDGWISGQYLTQATTGAGEIISSTLVPFDYPREATAHSTAQVFGHGEHVNVREEPSITSTVVTKAADGQVVSLRIDMVDTVTDDQGTRWWPVTVNGVAGWISGFHLVDSNDAPTTSPGETPAVPLAPTGESPATTVPETTGDFAPGEFVQVFTGDGTSVNLRASASLDAEVVGTLSDGQLATVVSGPIPSDASEAGWYEITAGGLTGFVDGDFLVRSVEAPSTAAPQPTEPPLSEEEEATQQATQQSTEDTDEPTPAPTEVPVTQIPETEVSAEESSEFIVPLDDFTRTQGFGCSSLPFYSFNEEYGCPLHNGLDLAAPSGTPLHAAAAGTVITSGWCNCGLGYYVEIDHGDGVHTLYGHMRGQPSVSAGQQVSQGEAIGEVGSTGISTGPHVHFMVTVDGVARNPENFLP